MRSFVASVFVWPLPVVAPVTEATPRRVEIHRAGEAARAAPGRPSQSASPRSAGVERAPPAPRCARPRSAPATNVPSTTPTSRPSASRACGGEPFGTWRATETEVSGFDFEVSNTNGGSITCEVTSSHSPAASTSSSSLTAGSATSSSARRIRWSCSRTPASSASAGTREYFDDYECEALDCGLCRCHFTGATLRGRDHVEQGRVHPDASNAR